MGSGGKAPGLPRSLPRTGADHSSFRVGLPADLQRHTLTIRRQHLSHPRLEDYRLPAIRARLCRAGILDHLQQDHAVDGGEHLFAGGSWPFARHRAASEFHPRSIGVARPPAPALGHASIHNGADVARHVSRPGRHGERLPRPHLRLGADRVAELPLRSLRRGDFCQCLDGLPFHDGRGFGRPAQHPAKYLRIGQTGRCVVLDAIHPTDCAAAPARHVAGDHARYHLEFQQPECHLALLERRRTGRLHPHSGLLRV